jgi:AcrR family transcriptional regulator
MAEPVPRKSSRKEELLERAYEYALAHGLTELSLRPLAAAIGSSPRVLLYLFGSKEGLIRALLARARVSELAFVAGSPAEGASAGGTSVGSGGDADLETTVRATWHWLAAEPVRPLLTLWTQAYAQSLAQTAGPWSGFAQQTVQDWLAVLGAARPDGQAAEPNASTDVTLALAVLRGGLLDLLATGDTRRVTAAIDRYLDLISAAQAMGGET